MRILLVSETPALVPLALRLQNEGHKVLLHSNSPAGKGMVRHQMGRLEESLKEGFDFALVEHSCPPSVRKHIHRSIPTIGPTSFTSRVTTDLVKAWKAATIAGCEFAKTVKLGGKDAQSRGRLCRGFHKKVKIFGAGGWLFEIDNGLSAAMLLEMIPFHVKDLAVQEVPEKMLKVAVGSWFNGDCFVGPLLIKTETHFRQVEGLGQENRQPEGIAMWTRAGARGALYTECLGKFSQMLSAADYRGPFFVNCYINRSNLLVSYFSAGYHSSFLLFDGWAHLAPFLAQIARADSKPEAAIAPAYCAVKFSSSLIGAPILNLNAMNMKHLWLQAVSTAENLIPVTTEEEVGYATAWGKDVSEAARRAYRCLKSISLPLISYRQDIGKAQGNVWSKLKTYKWI